MLVPKEERPSHWSLLGGGVEWMESTIDTLHREMQEEWCGEVTVEQWGWIIEKVFHV